MTLTCSLSRLPANLCQLIHMPTCQWGVLALFFSTSSTARDYQDMSTSAASAPIESIWGEKQIKVIEPSVKSTGNAALFTLRIYQKAKHGFINIHSNCLYLGLAVPHCLFSTRPSLTHTQTHIQILAHQLVSQVMWQPGSGLIGSLACLDWWDLAQ